MVSLTNNVFNGNVVDRWEDYVADAARSGIVWGRNRKPFSQMPNSYFGGNYNSPPSRSAYSSDGMVGNRYTIIYASTTRNGLINATTNWTHLRLMRARRYYNSQGRWILQYNATRKAYQTTGVRVSISAPSIPTYGPTNNGWLITRGSDGSNTGMEEYLARLRSAYYTRQNQPYNRYVYVCHYSCHYSCHGSRGRR
jgi:hypothetical protein